MRCRHHSLVTLIDWKQLQGFAAGEGESGHHSLVTPVDWEQASAKNDSHIGISKDTIYW